ncbi:regulator of microtubule dynamics protein 2 isoform X1 [Denticeps clupeoides]|uniref:regulator of microtubule dynamics protein 2 isoform X1 n=1 Tax=Denticeps clupeoides TaxID=299321 RepID=UPI0010A2D4C9|nr:regulator of microtubule dynamics protein 2 isoform X1 [Denticeps clupeoides]
MNWQDGSRFIRYLFVKYDRDHRESTQVCSAQLTLPRMAAADGKAVVWGVLVGAAGVTLAVAWYQSRKSGWSRQTPARLCLSSNDDRVDSGVVMPSGQREVLERLGALIQSVSDLKEEVRALKRALPQLPDHVRDELQGGRRGAGPVAYKASPLQKSTPTRRRRAGGSGASTDVHSSEEAESEGGYMTALTDSEEEEVQQSKRKEHRVEVDELSALLERADALHSKEAVKAQALSELLQKKAEFDSKSQFLWRLTRAYADAHDAASSKEEKKSFAEKGMKVGEEAITLNPACSQSHQWYAIMCGLMSDYDSIQNKIKNGYLFKDHLDKAIELDPQNPLSYYLLGRWCYAVAQCTWIERKIAATLFGEPPSATVHDALQHFLKAEAICPKYSKLNYVFLAKCYRDLGQRQRSREMCEAASSLSSTTKEDDEAQKELDSVLQSL